MSTIQNHLKRYPNCRPSTISLLQKREETTAKLRQELGMDAVTDRRARFVQETETKETVLQRLIRKLRKI